MWWIVLLFINTPQVWAVICDPGTYIESDICKDCPRGWSQSLPNQNLCQQCLEGDFVDTIGKSECDKCPSGYFVEARGAQNCTSCPAGFFINDEQASICFECSEGTYQRNPSSDSCDDCDAGQYSDSISATECKKCPIGFYQNLKAENCANCPTSSCDECPRGYVTLSEGRSTCSTCNTATCELCDGYGIIESMCQLCQVGQYSNGNKYCESCPRGFEAGYQMKNSGAINITDLGGNICVECERGSYYSQGKCDECLFGTYTQDYTCVTCPSGYFRDTEVDVSNSSDLCKECPTGFFGGDGRACATCPSGYYQGSMGQTACSPCKFPEKSPPGESKCAEDCPVGFEDSPFKPFCKTCEAGKDGTSATACVNCLPGRFKPGSYGSCQICPEGLASTDSRLKCQTCSKGKFVDTGEGICKDCPNGYYMESYTNSAPPLKCSPAPTGTYQSEYGEDTWVNCTEGTYADVIASIVCKTCETGRISTEGSFLCEECPSGYGANDNHLECDKCGQGNTTVDGSCQYCPLGSQSSTYGNETICVDCPSGYYRDVLDPTPCDLCAIGKKTKSTTECDDCPDGEVTNLVGEGSSFCIEDNNETIRECSPGSYYDGNECIECDQGDISPQGSSTCISCESNEYEEENVCYTCPSGKKVTDNVCTNCTSGKFGMDGRCQECSKGNWQHKEGQDSCRPCDNMQYTDSIGSVHLESCKDCDPVQYTVVVDGVCASCPPGRVTTDSGCQNCPGGTYRSATEEQCQPCLVGKASSSGNQCITCQPGKYADRPGLSECKNCISGVTATGCEVCAAGTFGVGCDPCPAGYWSLAGQDECSSCAVGLFQELTSQSGCLACQPGKFANEPASTVCEECLPGRYQPSERAGICIECLQGQYTDQYKAIQCSKCPAGTYTEKEGANSLSGCLECPMGTMEVNGLCIGCPERFYGDLPKQTACKACPDDKLSPKNSLSQDACFSKEGFVTYVFGMKGDSKPPQSYTKNCEIRPNLVMLCPGCSCDDDTRNGFWDGPICNECRRGFATRDCTAICPAYDGTHDSTMCNGNGFCWYGKFGDGLCYCGGKSEIDSTGENVVVDVRLCPKDKICPGYGVEEQTKTKYMPKYYIMQYRQFSVFVLMLNKYTPQRGHMWFKRFPPAIAYENTCLACTGGYARTPKTEVGYWNRDQDYDLFADHLQTLNGFHGENCQYECALCLNGGRCHNVPHPYRFSYTIEDTFRPQREIFLPQTNCICSSMVFDAENMCCPNGFQPFVHYGLRLNPDPYTRFNRLPYLTSIKNERRDYWINRDIYLEPDLKYITPFAEPADGAMYVANNNLIYSEVREDYIQMPYKEVGPYNKHVFYGVPREICRACPGLFGKGVRSAAVIIDTEEKAEEVWWDNAMGASARKCNGIGVCDFYKRPEEHTVKFMGDATQYRMYERGKACNALPIGGLQNRRTRQECIDYGNSQEAAFIAFAEPYKGGQPEDIYQKNGTIEYYETEIQASTVASAIHSLGYASYINGTEILWTVLKLSASTKMPIPDSDSPFTIYSTSKATCAAYLTCDSFVNVPKFNIYQLKYGDGDDRSPDATFDRFDTCFTYTKDDIEKFGLYLTQEYKQGQDPFLGGLCPKGYYCTELENVGYKEACPAGYYQPEQGVTRSVLGNRCNHHKTVSQISGCQPNAATVKANDYTDNVCIRCPRNFYAPKGSAKCTECADGSVKKISGEFKKDTPMLNIPTFFIASYNPWYYIQNEQGTAATDCALMPPGIIHIPNVNNYMTYDRKEFLSVMPCPFGLSSRPGTFSIDGFGDLDRLISSKQDSVIEAPYIRFDKTWSVVESETTCRCLNYQTLDETQCKQALQNRKISIMEERIGPKGCFIHARRSDVGFFSKGSAEMPSAALTYLCRSGVDNDGLAGEFARANCFRCPGNSITGPSSTTCTTCFANQMKLYAKEAIQKFAENAMPSLKTLTVTGTSSDDSQIPFSANLPNYALIYGKDDQNYQITYRYGVRGLFNKGTTELALSDCYLACSATEDKDIIAVGILEADSSECACSVAPAHGTAGDTGQGNTGFVWRRVTGDNAEISEEDCLDAAITQYGASNTHPGLISGGWSHVPQGCSVQNTVEAGVQIVNAAHWNNLQGVGRKDSGTFKLVTAYPSWGDSALPLCAACQPGKKTDGGCKSCEPGMYTETPSQADKGACQGCASGRFAAKTGSTGCVSCPLGYYQDELERQGCKGCPQGFAQGITGSVVCTPCSAGYYSGARASVCEACDAGQFTGDTSSSKCSPCEDATYTDVTASVRCEDCPAGYKHFLPAACAPCALGKFQTSKKQEKCTACAPGKYSPNEGRGSPCANCPYGWYQKDSGRSQCQSCPGGKVCGAAGTGAACSSGTYKSPDEWGSCTNCRSEKEARSDKRGCTWCSGGKTTYGKSGESCKNCPSVGWHGQGTGSMTTIYATIGVSTSIQYHSCPWGGSGWGCNGKGGRRVVKAYITALKSGVYKFYANIYDWGVVSMKFASGRSAGSWTLERKSQHYTWSLNKGQRVSIEMTYDCWGGTQSWSYWGHFYMYEPGGGTARNLKVYKSDPGSSYCANANIIKRL